MARAEPDAVSFVVRLWVEASADGKSPAVWRGRIVHVATGAYRYVTKLEQLLEFIRPYAKSLERSAPSPDDQSTAS
jgi:hypothetical protein